MLANCKKQILQISASLNGMLEATPKRDLLLIGNDLLVQPRMIRDQELTSTIVKDISESNLIDLTLSNCSISKQNFTQMLLFPSQLEFLKFDGVKFSAQETKEKEKDVATMSKLESLYMRIENEKQPKIDIDF